MKKVLLAFIIFTFNFIYAVDIYDIASIMKQSIEKIPNSENAEYPAISPNKTLITFTKNIDNNNEIFIMNIDGTNILRITKNNYDDFQSVFLDNENLIFVSNRDGNKDLYKYNILTKTLINITKTKYDEVNPYVTLDKQIIFVSNKTGKLQIFKVNSDGTGYRQLIINDYNDNFTPNLSPFGDKVLHSVFYHGKFKIIETDIKTQDEVEKTEFNSETYPIYSPTGKEFVLISTIDGNLGLYIAPIDSKNVRIRINNINENAYQPFWSINGNFLIYRSIEPGKNNCLKLIKIPKRIYNFYEIGENEPYIFSSKYIVKKSRKKRKLIEKNVYSITKKMSKKKKKSVDKDTFIYKVKRHFNRYGNYYISGGLGIASIYFATKTVDSLKKQNDYAKSGDKDKSDEEIVNTIKFGALTTLFGFGAFWTFFF